MTNYEAIKLLIEDYVSFDIHGDLWGHERAAEHLAERFAALEEKIAQLEDKLAKCEEHRANASWAEDYRRGMSF
jgi:hypothetical protein